MRKTALHLLIILFVSINFGISQNSTAGIYYINFQIEEELQEDLKIVYNDRKFLSGFSSQPTFSEELINSIKTSIENSVSKALLTEAECVYKTNRKGEKVYTIGLGQELEGMPVDRKGNAISEHNKDYYVRVNVYVSSKGGMTVDLPNGKRSRLKPAITYVIIAYDREGKKFYKEKVKVKDFGVLRAIERESKDGSTTVRKSQILYPEDIYAMLKIAIDKFHELN